MAKLSTYQKLKKQVASLRADLNELVMNPDSFESEIIRSDIRFTNAMNSVIMSGDGSDGKAKGLMAWGKEHGLPIVVGKDSPTVAELGKWLETNDLFCRNNPQLKNKEDGTK